MVHASPFQGTWYPGRSDELDQLLDRCFEESGSRIGHAFFAGALGYVVPHAGPAWSGAVAAAAYRAIEQHRPERIVVLAFPHHGRLSGVAVPSVSAISTPYGPVKLDAPWFEGFPSIDEQRVCDHSFEIQLPFLQRVAPQASIHALYVGWMDANARASAAQILAEAWRPGTIFLASSDLTHYGREFGHVPFPADSSVAHRLEELDHEYIDAAGSLDPSLFLDTLAAQSATVCGSGPISLLLDVLRRLPIDSVYQYTLDYQTSGERTNDYHHSVSYGALGYYPRGVFDLDASDCEALLAIARDTLEHLRRNGERKPVVSHSGSAALEIPRGVFVSLHRGAELLGCIGNCFGREPLTQEVAEMTLSAALDDPRFRPAGSTTGPIDIEISVLTPFRRVRGIESFRPGIHGAVMRRGRQTGLLLPQVAASHNLNTEEFFRALSRKAMMGPGAWRDPHVKIDLFEAQVFASGK